MVRNRQHVNTKGGIYPWYLPGRYFTYIARPSSAHLYFAICAENHKKKNGCSDPLGGCSYFSCRFSLVGQKSQLVILIPEIIIHTGTDQKSVAGV